MTQALSPEIQVAVVGAGAMGAGIAQVAAQAGHRVVLFDARPGAAEQAIAGIGQTLDQLAGKGRLAASVAAETRARLSGARTLDDLAGAGLVIEAIVEDLAAKQALFAGLEARVSRACLLATNTSSISVTAIGAALQQPQRLAGLHFFNPAPRMPLVEIISGLATAPEVAAALYATALAWGKKPVLARSTPGFIVNRVARPYYGEALRLLNEGAADCATLDAVFREAGGFRMGPFALMDMIGLDVNFAVTRSVWQASFNDPRFTPSLIQSELVAAGRLGRKSGQGFYAYGADAPPALPSHEPAHARPQTMRLYGNTPLSAALGARLRANGLEIAHAGSCADGRIAEAGSAVLYQTDGRSASQRAAENGIPDTVLLDLALDYASTPRLAMATAEQCAPVACHSACGLLQAAGMAVTRLADLPGLALMRTVCMLANEAADAVGQQVCTAQAVDEAMRLGTHYPQGPLAWADSLGLPLVHTVLTHLAAALGEDRYRISPLLHRHFHSGKPFHDPDRS